MRQAKIIEQRHGQRRWVAVDTKTGKPVLRLASSMVYERHIACLIFLPIVISIHASSIVCLARFKPRRIDRALGHATHKGG
jgi:hypothetical protein